MIPGEKKAAVDDQHRQRAIRTRTTSATAPWMSRSRRADAAAAPFGAPPGRNQKQLAFEYELATSKLALLDEPPERKPAWAAISPDDKTIVFARNHNLYMMDAENYAKAVKNANDASDQRDPAYHRRRGGLRLRRARRRRPGQEQQQEQQNSNRRAAGQGQEGRRQDNTRARQSAGNIAWSRDSKKFALVRRDSRKIPKLWVINALANPRPTLETYSYAMPGEANTPQSQLEIFDVAAKVEPSGRRTRSRTRPCRWSCRGPARLREHEKTESSGSGRAATRSTSIA